MCHETCKGDNIHSTRVGLIGPSSPPTPAGNRSHLACAAAAAQDQSLGLIRRPSLRHRRHGLVLLPGGRVLAGGEWEGSHAVGSSVRGPADPLPHRSCPPAPGTAPQPPPRLQRETGHSTDRRRTPGKAASGGPSCRPCRLEIWGGFKIQVPGLERLPRHPGRRAFRHPPPLPPSSPEARRRTTRRPHRRTPGRKAGRARAATSPPW